MPHFFEAEVIDSQHLKLTQPIDIATGSMVLVSIEQKKNISENQAWYLLSLQGLIGAYSDEEPEYTSNLVKTPNPDFKP